MNIEYWISLSEKQKALAFKEQERQIELFKQSVCHSFLTQLPPLKNFTAWTPMREWIYKCKPFTPTYPSYAGIMWTEVNISKEHIIMLEEHTKFIEQLKYDLFIKPFLNNEI